MRVHKGGKGGVMGASWKTYVWLHVLLFFNSICGVCSKLAARQAVFSPWFFLFYGMMLLILLGYAVFWQQIIKHIPLSTAYLNKPVSILWGIMWGRILFQEHLTIRMVVGALIVLSGVIVVVQRDE